MPLFLSLIIAFVLLLATATPVVAADWPDISFLLESAITDQGEPLTAKRVEEYENTYILEIPFGSRADAVLLPIDRDYASSMHLYTGPEGNTCLFSVSRDEYHEDYYDRAADTVTLPISDVLMTKIYERPYLNYAVTNLDGSSVTWHPQVYFRYGSATKSFTINRSKGMAASNQWLNVGAAFASTVDGGTAVKFYMVAKEGDREEEAMSEVVETTVAAVPATATKRQRALGLMTPDLAAGAYYVVMETIAADGYSSYDYAPYTVYGDADAYVKAALDAAIDFYGMEPVLAEIDIANLPFIQKLFYDALVAEYPDRKFGSAIIDHGGYFYETDYLKAGDDTSYSYTHYVGLSGVQGDTGTDWEAWIFPALGNAYPHLASNGEQQNLDFDINGDILSNGQEGTARKSYLDNKYAYFEKNNIRTAEDLYNTVSTLKDGFREIAAFCATGADPRDPFPGQPYSPNYLSAYIVKAYEPASIGWHEDGSPDLSKAVLRLNDEGALHFAPDVLFTSYFLLALEIANASEAEGYTEELKEAALKSILPYARRYVGDDFDPTEGAGGFGVDTTAMAMLPLCFLRDDETYGKEISAILDKYLPATAAILHDDDYAINVNTFAVLLNTLVCAGYTAQDLENDMFQTDYQSLLDGLLGKQEDNGGITYTGFNGVDRMATYQTLGALVDLYNGESVFVTANKSYLAKYPQYTDEGHRIAALAAGLPQRGADLRWTDILNVLAVRNTYTSLTGILDKTQTATLNRYFDSQLAVLEELESYIGPVMGAELAFLPDKEQVKISDLPHIQALRATYDALPDKDKLIANGEGNVNLSRLRDAETAILQWEAKVVADFIHALPAAADVTEQDRQDIEAARAAYDMLSDDHKALIDGGALKILREAERALERLVAKSVVNTIDALPAAGDVRITDQSIIRAARQVYDALSEEDKALVTNYSKLLRVESVLEELLKTVTQSVIDAIHALPEAAAITLAHEAQISDVRNAYNALSEEQKATVGTELLTKLKNAEDTLSKRKDGRLTITDMKDMTDKTAWYYEAVAWCVEQGLFQGDANRHFNPAQSISRAEFAQMIYNYYKDDEAVMNGNWGAAFHDVSADAWYYNAVTACAKAGIILGYDGNYQPGQAILRQDAALILMRVIMGQQAIDDVDVAYRLAELKNQHYQFPDFNDTGDYAQQAMASAAGLIFFGDDDGNLKPTQHISRAEVAQAMYNFLH